MRRFTIASAKGGVGKTTVSANLAVKLASMGHRVLCLDLDPQNALQLHLGLSASESMGLVDFASGVTQTVPLYHSPSGVDLVPYGYPDECNRVEFESALLKAPRFFERLLATLPLHPDTIVLFDTPPGPSVYLKEVSTLSEQILMVLMADAASYATFHRMVSLIDRYTEVSSQPAELRLLINQANPIKELAEDVVTLFRAESADMFAGIIHQDQAVSEALAHRKTVVELHPGSQAANDFGQLAQHLLGV